MNADKYYLGIELGSTRIKAVTVDENFLPQSSGSFLWESTLENGIWTYNLDQAWEGLRAAIELLDNRQNIAAMGISGMMHGYLAFDREWNLLTPFRTWQNTCTGPAATVLTQAFHFAIPQRWSIAHLFQAILDKEPHVSRIAHITTLAGYIHYMLTGVNAIGVGDASGMFPIDSQTHTYDAAMMNIFDSLVAGENLPWKLKEILPQVLTAGADAGWLTQEGSARLGGLLPEGIPFAPAEGDAGTGMTATNAVSPRTGNVSAGTSIFSMVVLERPLRRVYQEIDLVTTPSGAPVAMVHCNNCTGDSNAWVGVMQEAARLLGGSAAPGEAYAKLYTKSLEGEPDCGGVLVCNYLAGEGVTHLDAGRPMVIRRPDSRFTLANFFRATLYAALATLKIGMDMQVIFLIQMRGNHHLIAFPPEPAGQLHADPMRNFWRSFSRSKGLVTMVSNGSILLAKVPFHRHHFCSGRCRVAIYTGNEALQCIGFLTNQFCFSAVDSVGNHIFQVCTSQLRRLAIKLRVGCLVWILHIHHHLAQPAVDPPNGCNCHGLPLDWPGLHDSLGNFFYRSFKCPVSCIIPLHINHIQGMGLLGNLVQVVADAVELLHHGVVIRRRCVLGNNTINKMANISRNRNPTAFCLFL